MSQSITLTALDGHKFDAWRAAPPGLAKGGRAKAGLVVIQEIFGLNSHIRSVADGFAADGFLVIAPALFDRVERGVELGYDAGAVARGRTLRGGIPEDQLMADLSAAIAEVSAAGKIGAVGYCWGGTVAWMAAAQLPLAAAVAYYGSGIHALRTQAPRCPMQLHFGGRDGSTPPDSIAAIRAAQPAVESHVYADAEHGFNCDQRASYHVASAALARTRTLAFFAKHLS
ncbi:MAG: dienelactone hydrolase family protein [Alphaproteobacteria bacterium]|nr:dienelactone hydrolase family protein [Alphaproteobacteria bacterium]